MPELKEELRRLADEAARQAQPLPVAEVIRQGDRRHRRAITRWSLGRARAPGVATRARHGRRWPGWVAPLAAAGAVVAVVAGTAIVSSTLHGPRVTGGVGPAHGTTIYVLDVEAVTPVRTATNMPGKPIKVGNEPLVIAITPDGKTAYVSLVSAGVIPSRTATNTALPGIKTGYSGAIAITP